MLTAIFAGSFDPITIGHRDLIKRSFNLCDKLIVAIGENPAKKTLFSLRERIIFIEVAIQYSEYNLNPSRKHWEVASYNELLVSFAKEKNANLLIRGVRSNSDFEYEMTMAQINKKLTDIETVLLPADPQLSLVSSSMVKELARNNASVIDYTSVSIDLALKNKLRGA